MKLPTVFLRRAALSALVLSLACDDGSGTTSASDAGNDGAPNDAAVTPPPARIFVSDGTTTGQPGKVFVFDAATLAPVAAITVGAGASEIRATPDGSLVWVVSSAWLVKYPIEPKKVS